MNKGLRNQILRYMPEKIEEIKKEAEEKAKAAFVECCEKVKNGNFTPVTEDTIVVIDLYTGSSDENSVWKDFYNKKITELFSTEAIEVKKIDRGFQFTGDLHLKI